VGIFILIVISLHPSILTAMLQDFILNHLVYIIAFVTIIVVMGLILLVINTVLLFLTIQKLKIMNEVILKLVADVAAEKEVINGTKVLLAGLNTKLTEAIAHAQNNEGDLSQLTALAAEIEAQTADLSAAVVANTPAETAA
jgi:hypothetical protein